MPGRGDAALFGEKNRIRDRIRPEVKTHAIAVHPDDDPVVYSRGEGVGAVHPGGADVGVADPGAVQLEEPAPVPRIAEVCGAAVTATGHTRSDQAEAVVHGLLRGSGARGRAAARAEADVDAVRDEGTPSGEIRTVSGGILNVVNPSLMQ